MPNRMLSYSLVTIQFAALAGLALTGPWFADNIWLVVELIAVGLGIWSILAMRVGNFNITPVPKLSGEMIQSGPYRWIRHPMYSALILLAAALVISEFSWRRLFLLIVLVVDLVVKLNYEEQLLVGHFAGYAQFRKHTWRLIPYIY